MRKAIELLDAGRSLHEVETYLWLLNNRLTVLAELTYRDWIGRRKK